MDKKEQAAALFNSLRGKYIVGQALHKAIKAMEQVEPPAMRELSNIEDMKLMMEQLFPMFMALEMTGGQIAQGALNKFWKRMDVLQSNTQPGKEEV